MVDGIVRAILSRQNQHRDRQEAVALTDEIFDDLRQSLRGVLGGVVEENDGSGMDFGGDTGSDFRIW